MTTAAAQPPDAGRIVRVVGALVEARPMRAASLYELVRVGARGLLAEVVRLDGDTATLQVFEETSGLGLGEPVAATGESLALELGPGLLGSILDGLGRPLVGESDAFLAPGLVRATLDRSIRWAFEPRRREGEHVSPGDVVGEVEERPGIVHRVLVPPGLEGTLVEIRPGERRVDEPIAILDGGAPITMLQRWPVRRPRPAARRLAGVRPLVSGQRVFDFLFPVAEGGTVAVPGGFGTGKTIIEQSLAKFAEADIIVYVGCGERGNEMAELLADFPTLVDPRTGRPVLDRTVLIVNTSNMPVVAREASVFSGLTIAEFYRDMGYRVAIMVDSLSRWAEALREIGSRLREMPGEEGYPMRLADRVGKLFERAGRTRALGSPTREGAVTLIAAISPPGGDFSEPVTQAALGVTGALWALDPALANQRHFPAVDWETSYSLYAEGLGAAFAAEAGSEWPALRRETLELLQRDRELREISTLVGPEALEEPDRLVLEVARIVREAILSQSAFDAADAFSPLGKTYALARLAIGFYRAAAGAVAAGRPLEAIDRSLARRALTSVRDAPADALEPVVARAAASLETAVSGGVGR